MPDPRHDAHFPMPPGLTSRLMAARLLSAVLTKQRTVEQAWESEQQALNLLDTADAGFVRTLLLTTLRHLGQIDMMLGELIAEPLPSRAAGALDALRLALAQLLWLGTPAHAATHNAVEMTRQLRCQAYAALVNAVLQRVNREKPVWMEKASALRAENMPIWMRARLENAYGSEKVETILHAHAIFGTEVQPVVTDLSFKDVGAMLPLLSQLPEGAALLPNGTVRVPESGRPETWPGYDKGIWWVQDAAASFPAKILLSQLPERTCHVLDACAAPGGKTAQLAAAGHEVDALDLSAPRMKRLEENMARLQLPAKSIAMDASKYEPAELYDAVLLDAPCSATGTVRRHPELPWQRTAADVARLTVLQTRLLNQVPQWLKPGGLLVYAVCSLLPEEGEETIDTLLKREPRWQALPVRERELEELGLTEAQCTAHGALRLLPSDWQEEGGMDGFYIARLRWMP